MSKRPRPLLADLCLCALIATLAAVGTALFREYLENPYVRAGISFPTWVMPAALGASGAAWAVALALHLASGRRYPRRTLLATQFSFGVIAGLAAQAAV